MDSPVRDAVSVFPSKEGALAECLAGSEERSVLRRGARVCENPHGHPAALGEGDGGLVFETLETEGQELGGSVVPG